LFEAAGMALLEQRSFYHPTEAPTPSYLRFRASLLNRCLARAVLKGIHRLRPVLIRRAERAAAGDMEFFDRLPSPTRIMIFGRA